MWNQGSVFPLLIVTASGKFVGFFVYDTPAPQAGHLIASITAQAGTDPQGNAYLPGIVSYSTSAPFIAQQITSNKVQYWNASSQAGPWNANGPSLAYAGGANGITLQSGTASIGGLAPASLRLVPEAGAGFSGFGGSVGLVNQAAPPANLTIGAPMLFGNSSHLGYVSDSNSGDGGTYDTGRHTKIITANQNITSFGSNTVIGANSVPMTWPVAAGKYRIQGMLNWTQGGGGTSQLMGFSTTGTVTSSRIRNQWDQATQFAQQINTREASGALGTGASPAFAAATVVEWTFTGTITFSAGGTLSVVAAEGTNGNDFTFGADSYAELMPVVAT